MAYALKDIDTGLYFDGCGTLASLLNAKLYRYWADCPTNVTVDEEALKIHVSQDALLGLDEFYYINKQGEKRLTIVQLN